MNIPKEKFEFANKGEKLTDKKFDTKPIGYFKDAFIRFSKNKASVVAAIIIILIVLYAFLVPLFTRAEKKVLMDEFYPKKGPRIVSTLSDKLNIFNGGMNREFNERAYIAEISKGIGAEFTEETPVVTVAEGMKSKYQSVNKLNGTYETQQGRTTYTIYKANIDTYLSVGFIYKDFTQTEYQNIKNWEAETGLKVFYPLIAENEYMYITPDALSQANFWYKTVTYNNEKQVPVSTAGGVVTRLNLSDGLVLEDNYLRDGEGHFVYYTLSGGGDHETAQYRTRILYYNYYIYKNGFEPEYLLGTDAQGYDLATRMANGIKLSLLVAVSVSLVNFVIGALYGAVEGYYGGIVDLTLERVTDILSGIPFMVVATLFQMHLAKKVGAVPSLIFAFILTGWIGTAFRVRTQFYRFKNQEYVMAARTLGARDRRIIWKHIFPNTLGTIITSSVLVIPGVIFSESMLSYLGIVKLGGSKLTSLGTLLSDSSEIWTKYPHLMIAPSVIISLLMICFNLFGNGLRDAFNPQLRGVEE